MSFLGQRYQRGTVVLDNRVRNATESTNLGVNVIDFMAQRWDLELTLRPDNAGALRRSLMAHRARERWTSFKVPCPQPEGSGPSGGYLEPYAASDRLTLQAQASAGGTSVMVAKTTNPNIVLKPGRFISFAGHDKVYMTTNATDIEYDSATARSFTFTPELRADVANGSYVRLNPMMTVRHDARRDWAYDAGFVYSVTVYLQEVVA